MIGLVDGDIILYRACYSTEYNTYHNPEFGTFRLKKDLEEYLTWNYDEDEADILRAGTERIKVTEPFEATVWNLNSILNSIQMAIKDKLIVYVSDGKPTFRHNISYPLVYKGTRPPKPSNFQRAREYLANLKSQIADISIVSGIEVDDAISIAQWQAKPETTVICSIDKDLKQVPGYYYHIVNKTLEKIEEVQALKAIYSQMITGDQVDCIIGVTGYGYRKAEKALSSAYNEHQMEQIVRDIYKKEWPNTHDKMYELNKAMLTLLKKPLDDSTKP